jgi:glutaminyl-peptide cyclotransferase
MVREALDRIVRCGVPRVTPRIVGRIPHDPRAFTQGLACRDGWLYESTGGHAGSGLSRVDPGDGRIVDRIPVPDDFAEGIAILDSRLYQLSWLSGKVRIYDFPSLTPVGEATYNGQGWGLASGPMVMAMSDGTSVIQFRDASFVRTGSLRVRSHGFPVRRLNDLEWVGTYLYANVLGERDVFEISAQDGRVRRVIDCSALAREMEPLSGEEVLNGIAYDGDRGTFFLTGKRWRSYFEVEIPGVG